MSRVKQSLREHNEVARRSEDVNVRQGCLVEACSVDFMGARTHLEGAALLILEIYSEPQDREFGWRVHPVEEMVRCSFGVVMNMSLRGDFCFPISPHIHGCQEV